MARDRSITDELGIRLTAAAAAELYGWVLMLADDLPAAEAEARRGFDSLLEMGDRSSASTLAAVLAQILYARGRYDEVLELTALGRDESSPDDLHTQIQWRGPRAKVLARRGEAVEAERLAREGVELAEPTDFLNVRAHGAARPRRGAARGRPRASEAAAVGRGRDGAVRAEGKRGRGARAPARSGLAGAGVRRPGGAEVVHRRARRRRPGGSTRSRLRETTARFLNPRRSVIANVPVSALACAIVCAAVWSS